MLILAIKLKKMIKGNEMKKLEKKTPKSKAISTKITEEQNEKLENMAKKSGITKSNLIFQLISIGFGEVSKSKGGF